MNTVHLHGDLARFGGPYTLAADTAQEAIRALVLQIEGLEDAIMAGHFRLIRKRNETEFDLDMPTLTLGMDNCELHIHPVLSGAANGQRGKGIGKVLLGVALIGAAIITGGAAAPLLAGNFAAAGAAMGGVAFAGITYGTIAAFGAMIAFGGLATLFAPSPKGANPNDNEDQKASFLFNGPVNVSEQGHPLQLIYGRYRVGSIVGSADLLVEQLLLGKSDTYDWATDTEMTIRFPFFPHAQIQLS